MVIPTDTSFRQQSTLADRVSVEGFGFWSSQDVRIEFRPAAADTGIVFVREDLAGTPRIRAQVALRVDKDRRTNLASHSVTVEMVEHVMAALAGLQIDNCEIWTTASEMPGCDGSSLAFAEAIQSVGRRFYPVMQPQFKVTEVLRVGDDQAWIEARPTSQGMTVEYHLDYGKECSLTAQSACHLVTTGTFLDTLAPARTFILQHEADHLRSQGLGQRVTNQDLLVFGPDGPVENQCRFDNECARHKSLDMIGDMALCGVEFVGHFIGHQSGHQLNAQLAAHLQQLFTDKTAQRRIAS